MRTPPSTLTLLILLGSFCYCVDSKKGGGVGLGGGGSGRSPFPASTSKDCTGVNCASPPGDGNCKKLGKNEEPSISRPVGAKMDCCELWKCQKTGESNFFTFHGLKGQTPQTAEVTGTETVVYENNGLGRSVSSSGTGSHDSTANRMNQDEMDELNAALKEAGMDIIND